ncbi:hypothetical protein QTI17_30430 [Variovorax sp. J31P179]|uniref:hypothetical protein n=1 Tax=Variovorax sp. J31P179 TaxID=3053508 RepID=UPI00257683BE|nr:hypothetical protein [Variovorax sp. J31P179]MDM0084921.1 hypothetical protein [Variovorax sp. J31P179]
MSDTLSRRTLLPLLASLLLCAGFHGQAGAWASANRFGGHSSGGWGGAEHTNAWGGSTSHSWDGATTHTNARGGTTTGVAGYGAVHTTAGGYSAYRPPAYGAAGYAPYHAPVAVPYYHAGCYDCAGAVAAGAVVGVAAGAAVATANRGAVYPMGVSYARVPAGAVMVNRYGVDYYQVGDSWFRPFYGANGVYYTVVGAP